MALTPGMADLDGLELGPGTAYVITQLGGFGLPGMRTNDTSRVVADGARVGPDFLTGRDVNGVVTLKDDPYPGGDDLAAAADALVGVFAPRRTGLGTLRYWRRGDDAPRRIGVRPRRLDLALDGYWWRNGLAIGVPFSLFAPDPRWYADGQSSLSMVLPTAASGRTYDRTYPMAYGGGTSGVETAANVGNVETFPTWTITGPVVNPRLENVTTGETLEMAITLAVGETLEVDMQERTVLLGGTASRYSTIVGAPDFWALAPGGNSVRFAADAYDAAASATIVWRSAWLG